jgi:hypothetical protein
MSEAEGHAIAWAFSASRGLHSSQRLILVATAILSAEESAVGFFVARAAVLTATGIGERQLIRIFQRLCAKGLLLRDERALGERNYFGHARYRPACFEPATVRDEAGIDAVAC